jgi:hypothetical protein
MVTSLNGDGMDGRMVEIYGPVGTQDLLRVSMEVTRPVLQFNYRVYELAEPSDDEVVSEERLVLVLVCAYVSVCVCCLNL